jgi:amidohydrolase
LQSRNADRKDLILRTIDSISGGLIDLAGRIHENPEIAFQEVQASRWLIETLGRHGFAIELGVADLPTAFRAELDGRGAGPTVAFLAEYDGLPEIGHACGHNLICTGALGAGIGLASVINELPGKVVILGTPAEEHGGGKVLLLERGAFRGVDAAIMFHPSSTTLLASGSLASYRLNVEFLGKAAHAAAAPFEGVNALDALVQMFVNIGLLRQQLRDDARVHGIITYGGAAPNIIPDRAGASFSIRAADREYAAVVLEKVIRCGKAGAEATGSALKFESTKGYDALRSNGPMADAFGHHLNELGWTVDPIPAKPRMGSTDMGDVSQALPVVQPFVKIADDVAWHTVEFREAAHAEQGMRAMLIAAKAMALTGFDYLTDPNFREEVQLDFQDKRERQ